MPTLSEQKHQAAVERARKIRERIKAGATMTVLAKEQGVCLERIRQLLHKHPEV